MAIPTLTDIGNRIVQGVGTLTGQIRNPFDDMISQLEERLQATNNEDEIVKLNDQLRTLRAASEEWSGYDIAKQDPTAAPEWMQSVHNAARVGGDNLDLVDVGTAFIPVGVATKGAALVGRGLGKAGRGLGALATKYVDSAAARAGEKAAEAAVKNRPIGPKVQRTLNNFAKAGIIDKSSLSNKALKTARESAKEAKKSMQEANKVLNAEARKIERADELVREYGNKTDRAFNYWQATRQPNYQRLTGQSAEEISALQKKLSKDVQKYGKKYEKAKMARQALNNPDPTIKSNATKATRKYNNAVKKLNEITSAKAAARTDALRSVDQIGRSAYTRAANQAAAEAANSAVARGLTAAGEGATRFGTDFARGAEWLASHPAIGGAAEQGIIEGAHGAASYNPEYSPSMGLNALEQGGLAGLMQGGVSALGGRRLRAIHSIPENVRAREGLESLGKVIREVPQYDPIGKSGMLVADPGDIEFAKKLASNARYSYIDPEEMIPTEGIIDAVNSVNKEMGKKIKNTPIEELYSDDRDFVRMFGFNSLNPGKMFRKTPNTSNYYLNMISSPWARHFDWRLTHSPLPKQVGDKMSLRDVYEKIPDKETRISSMMPHVHKYNTIAAQRAAVEADDMLRKKLFELTDWPGREYFIKEKEGLVGPISGLAGLHYAPLPKGAVSNKLADVYSAQTEPLKDFGTAGYRAAYNALLDAAREGGLAGLGYVDYDGE